MRVKLDRAGSNTTYWGRVSNPSFTSFRTQAGPGRISSIMEPFHRVAMTPSFLSSPSASISHRLSDEFSPTQLIRAQGALKLLQSFESGANSVFYRSSHKHRRGIKAAAKVLSGTSLRAELAAAVHRWATYASSRIAAALTSNLLAAASLRDCKLRVLMIWVAKARARAVCRARVFNAARRVTSAPIVVCSRTTIHGVARRRTARARTIARSIVTAS